MRTNNVISPVKPEPLTVRKLPNETFEIMACQDITENSTEAGTMQYNYTMYLSATTATDYESMVQAIMHTRYSYDDEMGIINDFLEHGETERYTQYTQYRAAARIEADKIFEKEVEQ